MWSLIHERSLGKVFITTKGQLKTGREGVTMTESELVYSLKCPGCGIQNDAWVEACPGCGAKLMPSTSKLKRILYVLFGAILIAAPIVAFLTPHDSPMSIWGIVILALLLLIGIVTAAFNIRRLVKGDPIEERFERRLSIMKESGSKEDLEQVATGYAALSARYPDNTSYPNKRLDILISLSMKDEAEKLARLMVDKGQVNLDSLTGITSLCKESEDLEGATAWKDEADKLVRSMVEKGQGDVDTLTKMASCCIECTDFEEASSWLDKAEQKATTPGKLVPVIHYRASLLMAKGLLEQADAMAKEGYKRLDKMVNKGSLTSTVVTSAIGGDSKTFDQSYNMRNFKAVRATIFSIEKELLELKMTNVLTLEKNGNIEGAVEAAKEAEKYANSTKKYAEDENKAVLKAIRKDITDHKLRMIKQMQQGTRATN